jgi:hypothetical protein
MYRGRSRRDSANRVKNCGGLQLFVIMLDRRTVCAGVDVGRLAAGFVYCRKRR